MKKAKIIKIFVLVLSVALVCAGVALSVSASDSPSGKVAKIGNTEYASFEEALSAAENGSTITLMSDVEMYETASITRNLTIDMNGCTITSNLETAFNIEKSVSFVIEGYGKINLGGRLIYATSAVPSVTVAGTDGTIIINHDGSSSPSIVAVAEGSYTFNNLDITAVTNGSSKATFHVTDKTKGSKFSFVGVRCNVTGCSIGSGVSAESVIRAVGSSTVSIKYSSISTDGVAITLNDNTSADDMLTIENSYIKASSASYEISAIGMYATALGTISVRDSVIESSYRVFAMNNESVETVVQTDENGIITATGGARILLYDSTVYLNGYKATQIVRACPTFLYGSSKIITATEVNLVQYDTTDSSYTGTNKYVNIYMAEGTRVSREKYTTLAVRGVKFPDGSSPSNSTTYTFIYDPLGDIEAPYVVAKAGATDKLDTSSVDYFYFANGSDSYASSADGVIYLDSATKSSTVKGDMFGAKGHWWNRVGEYSVTSFGGNACLKYATTAANATASLGPQLVVGKNLNNGIYEPDYSLIIIEADIATDTGTFTNAALKFHVRGSASGDTDSNGFSNYGNGSAGIAIYSDGSIAGQNTDTFVEGAALSTTGWNRLTMVIDATTTHPTDTYSQGSVTYKYGGTVHFYVNGELIATSTKAYLEGGYIFGFRADIYAKQALGRSLLVDNVVMRGYKNVASDFSLDNYMSSSYNLNLPLNEELIYSDYTVGGIACPDLESAVNAATSVGTLANVNRDLSDIKVSFNGTVATGGHTIEVTDDSNKAVFNTYSDGSIASYTFDSKYNAYVVNYHWFKGDINSESEWLDPSYYITTKLGIGQTPKAPEEIVIPEVIDYIGYSVKTHSGWDYDGDGKNAVEFDTLTYSQAIETTDVYLYPTYDINPITVIIEDNAGNVIYYTTSNNLNSSVWSNFRANTTMKLLSDFVVSSSSGFMPNVNGAVYNLDFNGHTIFLNKKVTYIQVQGGATLNIYSSVPGGMFYGIELTESTSDKTDKVGAGVFVQIKETGTESLANAKLKTESTAINIGTVTVGGNTYPGSNLTLAGDCVIEPRFGGANAKIKVDGATLVRPGSDYGAMIFSRFYYGDIQVKNTTFIVASSGKQIFGNHSNGDGATCTASFDNCVFLYDVSSSDSNVIFRNNGFKYVKFTNCVTNGRLNPATANGITSVGDGNAAVFLDFRDSDYLSGISKVKYNAAMQMPTIGTPSYYNPDNTSSETAYISQLDNGVIRIQRWLYSSDTSISTYGGAVTNGYLYIVPNGYTGNIPADATSVLELPLLAYKSTDDTVTVTYNDFSGNAATKETYAIGGSIVEYPDVTIADVSSVITAKVFNGNWDKALPVTNLTEDVTLTPMFDVEARLDALKASVSLYTDFKVNLYIPAEYSRYITSVKNGNSALELSETVLDGANYLKASISLASFEAVKDAVFTVNVTEAGTEASGTVSLNIASYAKAVIDDTSSSDADIKLVNYMAAYANAALAYFRGTEDKALSLLLSEVEDYAVGEAKDTALLAPVFKGATVDLGPSLSCVLYLKDGFVGTVSVIGQEFVVTADSEREIVLEGLALTDFAKDIVISAADEQGNEVVNASYNLSTFVQYHIANAEASAESAQALDLIVAFYNYVCAAEEYVSAANI